MNDQEYDGIEYHADRAVAQRYAAINVKCYARLDVPEAHEQYAQQAWENVAETFWEELAELAHERGYSCVFAEGRSGGWAVPYYQVGMAGAEIAGRNLRTHPVTRVPLFQSSPGQGGTLGYPRYPDMDSVGERSRFRAFARRVETMLAGVPDAIREEARQLAELEAAAV